LTDLARLQDPYPEAEWLQFDVGEPRNEIRLWRRPLTTIELLPSALRQGATLVSVMGVVPQLVAAMVSCRFLLADVLMRLERNLMYCNVAM